MKTKLLLLSILQAVFFFSQAQQNEFDKDVLKFLQVNGSKQTMTPVVDQLIGQFRLMKPDVPDEFWAGSKTDMLSEMEALNQKMIPIYKKHFTHEEIKGLIEFYESPLGKSFTSKSALLVPETMKIGQQWGMEIAAKVQQKLAEKGY